jgi:hypothetical protein
MPYVHIDIELEEFDDDEIIEEYELRGLGGRQQYLDGLTEIYQLRRLGKSFENELNKLICDNLGVVI